jgi:hypothetical protein
MISKLSGIASQRSTSSLCLCCVSLRLCIGLASLKSDILILFPLHSTHLVNLILFFFFFVFLLDGYSVCIHFEINYF